LTLTGRRFSCSRLNTSIYFGLHQSSLRGPYKAGLHTSEKGFNLMGIGSTNPMAWTRIATSIGYGRPLFRSQFRYVSSKSHCNDKRALFSSIHNPTGEQTITKIGDPGAGNEPNLHKYNRWYRPAAKRKRTLFYVPGSSERMIQKAWKIIPDIIVNIQRSTTADRRYWTWRILSIAPKSQELVK
jgi:hypothetical protein